MRLLIATCCLLLLSGCGLKTAMEHHAAREKEKEAANPPKPAPPPPPKADPGPDGKGIIGKMTDEVLDYQKAMKENPNLIEVNPKAKGNDYFSFMASAYVNVRAQVSMLGMEQQLKTIKIVEERNPSHKEIVEIMHQYQIKFTMLPRYRKYAYDAQEGRFVILEDPVMKDQIHEGRDTE